MASTLNAGITHGSKSRVSDSPIYPGQHELNHNYHPRYRRRHNDNNLRVSIEQVEWGQYNPYLRFIRRNRRFGFNIHTNNSWFRFLFRNYNKSRESGTRSPGNRKNNRNYCYYYIALCLLTIGLPVRAEPEVQNTSNPVAAATGNVTNQAVQFQNNNGATMTFSPFYMGNHTTPFDEDMEQQSYTVAENWGFQINFMVPLDGSIVERCKALGARQEEKMRLDYELVRIKECAALQQKGFMLLPGSRIYNICSDVIPIASWKKAQQKVLACKPPEKPWYKPWVKPKSCETIK